MARGELRGARVVVDDERDGHTLYNKGAYGTPRAGGGLDLTLVEAAYLAEMNRLDIHLAGRRLDAGEVVVHAAAVEEAFPARWLAYRDLRNRTLLVKEGGPADLLVYPRKGFPGRTPASHVVFALGEGATFDADAVVTAARDAKAGGRKVLAAVADDEADVTFYDVDLDDPRGDVRDVPRHLPGVARLLDDRVLVEDALLRDELAKGYFGRVVGDVRALGLAEAQFLAEASDLRVETPEGDLLDADRLRAHARRVRADADLVLDAYRDLRERGLVPRTGFKYGTHFRTYRGDPDEGHAPLLVHALAAGRRVPWPEVAGFIRVAHGVRKSFLLRVGEAFLRLTWTRPK